MQKTLRKRILALLLAFSMLVGCMVISPGIITNAATDQWSNITDGKLNLERIVEYTGKDLAVNQYVSEIKFDFGKAQIGNDSSARVRIIYDYTDENNYHTFTYRTTSQGQLMASLTEIENGVAKADSQQLVITNIVGSNLKKGASPRGVNSGIFGTLNTSSNRIIDSHSVTLSYLSETEIEFKISYVDTMTSQQIVVGQFAIENVEKNYFSNKINAKLETNKEVHVTDIQITPKTKSEAVNHFKDWCSVDSNGVVTKNQLVRYIGLTETDQYLSSANFKVKTSKLRTNDNNHMKIIYDYVDNDNYSYLAFRLTNGGNLYASLGKSVDGVLQAGIDSGACGTKNIRKHATTLGAVNPDIRLVSEGTADNFYFSISYVGANVVQITFSHGTDKEQTLSIVITSMEVDKTFTQSTNSLALLATADVTLAGSDGIDAPTVTFEKKPELWTEDAFLSKYVDLIYMDLNTVAIEHKALLQEALNIYETLCKQDVKDALTQEKALLDKLLQRVQETELQQQLGIQRPTIAEGFYDDFENPNRSKEIWRNAGRFGIGASKVNMTVATDEENPNNHYMLLQGGNAFVEPYFFVQPNMAALKEVSFDVTEFSKLTDTGHTMKWQLLVGYQDAQNYSYFNIEYVKRLDKYRITPRKVLDGNSIWVSGQTEIEAEYLVDGFHVNISYDDVALVSRTTIIPNSAQDMLFTLVNNYTHPASMFAISMLEQECEIGIDNVNISYKEGDWDTDYPILDIVAYYAENTKVSPGDVTMISGDNLGKTVKEVRIMELPKETTKMGYVLQESYDKKATEAECTESILPQTLFSEAEALKADIIQTTEHSIKFEIPSVLNEGAYLVKLVSKYASKEPAYLYINRPVIDYVVGDEGGIASPGGTVRVIGKHLAHYIAEGAEDVEKPEDIQKLGVRANLKYKAKDGSIIEVDTCKITAVQSRYSLTVSLPENLRVGTYELSIYNGSGGNGAWSEPVKIEVAPSPRADRPTEIFDVTSFGADPSADSIDTAAFISAFDAAAQNGGGTVYVPQGVYTIGYTLHVPKNVHLMGDGITKTTLMFSAAHYDYGQLPETIFAVQGDFEVSKMSIEANRCKSIFYSPVRCENIYVHDVRTQATPQRGRETSGGGGQPLISPSEAADLRMAELSDYDFVFNFYYDVRFNSAENYENIQIENCELLYFTNYRISGDYTQIRNVKFNQKDKIGATSTQHMNDGKYSIIENCTREGGQAIGHNNGYNDGNEFGGVIRNNSEIQTNDGGPKLGQQREGIMQEIEGSNGLQYLILNDVSFAKNQLRDMTVAVLEGMGNMQIRTITASDGNIITIDSPFVVPPNRNSRVQIYDGLVDAIHVNNEYSTGSIVGSYGPLRGTVFDNCSFTDSAGSILRTHYDGTNWYMSITNCSYQDSNFIHVNAEGDADNSRVGGIHFDSSSSRTNGIVSVAIRNCQFYDGSFIRMQVSGVGGNLQDILIDQCEFYDAEYALLLPSTEIGKNIIDGILINQMCLTNVKTGVKVNETEQQDLYQSSVNNYKSAKLIIRDSSEKAALEGDVNQDGVVNGTDVYVIQLYLCGRISLSTSMMKRANIDDSNEIINIKDALLLNLRIKNNDVASQ